MRKLYYLTALLPIFLLAGCGGTTKTVPQAANQVRPVEALPAAVAADTITVAQFRYVCDMMARDLVRQPFVVRAARPPIVTVRKIQNKTGIYIDEQIFQETIRGKLMENAGGLMLFRDDVSYKDIIQERVRQSNEELTVTLTDTVLETKTHDRVREREFESGSLSGAGGTGETTSNIEEESAMDMSQTASVKSKVAAADYFMRGIIFQVNERDMTKKNSGMSYFQYQFRVVDARSGLIVWEKMLSSKMAGEYMLAPQQQAPAGNNPNAPGGQAPAGWPAVQINQPGMQQTQPGTVPGQIPQTGTQQQAVPQQNSIQQMQQLQQQLVPIIQQFQK
ncbi:MAG: penicillin-binding protein activator LpoB [Desulfobulbaceae bacterium]|nr:penicillin-binding protein activator LpoB [Desulfobulbaceae bacterium]